MKTFRAKVLRKASPPTTAEKKKEDCQVVEYLLACKDWKGGDGTRIGHSIETAMTALRYGEVENVAANQAVVKAKAINGQ